jgi:hypothetical protein
MNSQEIKKSYVRCKDREKTQTGKRKISDEKKKCQKNKCVVSIGLTENFDSCIADKFVGPHLSEFTKKMRQVNKK